MRCPKCGANVPDNHRFCTICGTNLNNVSKVDQPVSVVRNKAIWEIQQGEVARKISELDFVNLDMVSGIVVQPGVTAVVYVDGREVAQLSSGIYEFVEDADIKAEMEKRVESSGVRGGLIRLWKGFVKVLMGKKVNQQEAINTKQRSVPEIISLLNANSIIAVYLKRDANFTALFGSSVTADGRQEFVPMTIRTRVLDAKVGVHMFLKIVDFYAFIRKFMLERSSVRVEDVQNDLTVFVKNILQEELRNEDIDDFGISQAAKDRISDRLAAMSQFSDGIGFVRVAEISCANDAFDRFRQLSQELWCSEQELDYLRRTGDFKNRLARETNKQAIDNARNEQELKGALMRVNMDDLLTQDELDSFTMALATKKFKREQDASNYMAMTQMQSMEEQGKLGIAVQTKLTLAQLDADDSIYDRIAALERKKQMDVYNLQSELNLRSAMDDKMINKIQLDTRRDTAAFEDERRDSDFDFTRKRLNLALDIDERMNEQEQSNLDRANVRERVLRKDEYAHDETMAGIHAGMTPEQMMAEQLSKLDASAQAVYASSFVSKKEEEIAKVKAAMYEDEKARLAAEYKAKEERDSHSQDKMYDFLKEVVHSNAATAGAVSAKAEQRVQEYREDAKYQQSRVDHTQDKALEYTTSVHNASKPGVASEPKRTNDVFCPYCGRKLRELKGECPACGEKLD